MIEKIKEIHKYRHFLFTSVKKEFRGKYKKSFLGVLWSFINPLLQLLIYSIIFPLILKIQEDNYAMFLFTALLPWNYFSNTLIKSTSTIICNSGILKKVYFPRELLPIAIVISNSIEFLISSIIVLIALFISGIGVSIYILFFPLILIIQIVILLPFSFLLSAYTVYIRDLEHFISIFLQLWLYLTPVMYSIDIMEDNIKKFFLINPMTTIICAYRDILYYQKMPDLGMLFILLIIGCVATVLSYILFKKLEKKFIEEL